MTHAQSESRWLQNDWIEFDWACPIAYNSSYNIHFYSMTIDLGCMQIEQKGLLILSLLDLTDNNWIPVNSIDNQQLTQSNTVHYIIIQLGAFRCTYLHTNPACAPQRFQSWIFLSQTRGVVISMPRYKIDTASYTLVEHLHYSGQHQFRGILLRVLFHSLVFLLVAWSHGRQTRQASRIENSLFSSPRPNWPIPSQTLHL